jgi:hypothetical protein
MLHLSISALLMACRYRLPRDMLGVGLKYISAECYMAKVRPSDFVAPMDAAAIGMATGGGVPLLLVAGLVTMVVLLAAASRWRRADGLVAPSPPLLPLLGHLHLLMGKPPRWPAARPSSRCAWARAQRCWCPRASRPRSARGGAGDVRRIQEIVEETFAVTGAPSLGDFFPALRWVDRLRGINAVLARLQSRRDAFVSGLVRDAEKEGGAIYELLYLQCVVKETLRLRPVGDRRRSCRMPPRGRRGLADTGAEEGTTVKMTAPTTSVRLR